MSRIVTFSAYGGPEVLETSEVEPPDAGAGRVRVHVRAAGVSPFDVTFRRGGAASWKPAVFPQTLGNEIAGMVDLVGDDVTAWTVGDEVLGWVPFTGYADHAVVRADHLVAKPAGMPWDEAGVLTASGQTAATALADLAVTEGETLLVHAAAGGVGSYAVQLGVAYGATVVGTASERNHDYLRELGVIPVTYGDGLADRVRAAAPEGVDAALDAAGTEEALRVSVELVADRDRVGTLVDPEAAKRLGVRALDTRRSTAKLAGLVELYEQGRLRVAVSRTYRLDQAAEAHRALETGHVRGKVVLLPD
ncbi:MAG: zinc-binding dehydrogenase [Streptosporangiales bacterium]|nr:zinc-binding dehydrogenase [Streptosporangiales bacterium]